MVRTLPFPEQVEGDMSVFVVGDPLRAVVELRGGAVCHCAAGEPLVNLLVIRDVAVMTRVPSSGSRAAN